jgi:hypothetical protein
MALLSGPLVATIAFSTLLYAGFHKEINSSERLGFLITTSIATTGILFYGALIVVPALRSHSWVGRHRIVAGILIMVIGNGTELVFLQFCGLTGLVETMFIFFSSMAINSFAVSFWSRGKTRVSLTLETTATSDTPHAEPKNNQT